MQIHYQDLNHFPIHKHFWIRLMIILIDMVCLMLYNQSVDIQKISETQYTIIFPMTNSEYYKITHRSKIHSKYQMDQ
jgi:hypothetical protein